MAERPPRGDKKLRYGFIGAGGIAGEHLTHLADRRDVEIVALADPSEQTMARHAAKFGVKQTFGDWKEMLAKTDLDAVSICTPNKLHAQCAIGAMEAG
ncbi:MAG: Gfo/Idh/MocA family oxidoreductase, partial [Proteobacteria bacterium]|nr:Gfo/Idh/MocA family oxidoreductase [Pseudomonadota bacterium]